MPLIRKGEIVPDSFIWLSDDSPIPDETAIIVTAARFLVDPSVLAARRAPTGVAWPNNRRVAELAPYLDRLALVALTFPSFRDGRAYSQARQLREQHGFAGELRATGEVLRDQFLFLLRAGFDSLEVRKEADAAAFAETVARYSVFYQATGDGRGRAAVVRLSRSADRMPSHANENVIGARELSALNASLDRAAPERILEEAICIIRRERLAIVSSFGIELAVLLHLVAGADRSLPVIFLDTGWLFGETLAYRDTLIAHLGLTGVRTIRPDPLGVAFADPGSELWSQEPDACCHLRKVAPLTEELRSFDAWITGRKRYQGGERTGLAIVEREGPRLKFNPFARTTQKEIAARFRAANLPRHPLGAAGYLSIGCLPCSTRTRQGEGVRDGRWRGTSRTECGIHA